MLGGELAVPCNSQSALVRLNSSRRFIVVRLEVPLHGLGNGGLVAHVVIDRPAQVLAAADVELAVVQRAGEDPALQRALVQRRVLMPTAAAHGEDGAVVLAEADLAVRGAHVLHAAGGDVVELRYFVPHLGLTPRPVGTAEGCPDR